MDIKEKIFFKASLKQWAIDCIEQRVSQAIKTVKSAQDAANSEEKSSAGDKYETGRAMAHLETDMHNRLLADIRKELNQLQLLNISRVYETVVSGAFVRCDDISFFIAVGLGKQVIEGSTILYVSPQSPLFKELHHKKISDYFVFQGRKILIREIF